MYNENFSVTHLDLSVQNILALNTIPVELSNYQGKDSETYSLQLFKNFLLS